VVTVVTTDVAVQISGFLAVTMWSFGIYVSETGGSTILICVGTFQNTRRHIPESVFFN
jgi:hypothetical protein